ncbi:hypothetical protein [Ornithinibacillus sp. 179-J 7C1 HS]|uniref:hypothetical protein n=1 Tax=Ornithinibacillus sp. 179-J 7C1 HS TaxID=3142384 RepID=UPI0039A1E5ED
MIKSVCSKALKTLAVFLIMTLMFIGMNANPASAAPPSCKWGVGPEIMGVKTNPVTLNVTEKDSGVTIQCGPNQQWGVIRSQATKNNTNGRYVNYSNTGGYSKAKSHFDAMPGTVRSGNSNLKDTSEGTVTLYRSTGTNGNPWSLQYNIRGQYYIDKIRYYDGPIPIQSFKPIEVE